MLARRTDIVLSAAAIVLLSLSIYVHFVAGNVGDKDWLLLAARMWLHGKKLYVDIFESNPPLILWIYALPVAAERWLGILDYHALVLLGLCVIALSIAVSMRVVAFHPELMSNKRKQIEFAVLLAFVLIFFTSPAYFFDREHIFLLLVLPYVFRLMPSVLHAPIPRNVRIITGLMAGVGFCIKPHCMLVFLLVQLIAIVQERRARILWSGENLIIYMVGALYLGAILFFTPEYIFLVLPMALLTYGEYNNRVGGIFFLLVAGFTFAVTFVDFRLRYSSPYRKDIFYFLGVSAALLGYALVNNGWGYTYNPLSSFLLITTGFVFWEYRYLKQEHAARAASVKQFEFGERACLINFFCNAVSTLIVVFLVFTAQCDDEGACKQREEFPRAVEKYHAQSFGNLAMNFGPWSMVARDTGATLETRFNHLWMMPRMISADAQFIAAHHWIIEYVAEALAHDLDTNKPEIVFVDSSPEFFKTGKHIDLPKYFGAFANFKQAWQHYHYRGVIDSCSPRKQSQTQGIGAGKVECRYDIYRRDLR